MSECTKQRTGTKAVPSRLTLTSTKWPVVSSERSTSGNGSFRLQGKSALQSHNASSQTNPQRGRWKREHGRSLTGVCRDGAPWSGSFASAPRAPTRRRHGAGARTPKPQAGSKGCEQTKDRAIGRTHFSLCLRLLLCRLDVLQDLGQSANQENKKPNKTSVSR